MRIRHRYLIARAAVFATLLVSAAGTAVSVASAAEQARMKNAASDLPSLAMRSEAQS